jgi:hypothetical protein
MLVVEERFHPTIFIVMWGRIEEADFVEHLQCFRTWASQGKRVLVVSDPRSQEFPNAHWRKRFATLADQVAVLAPGTIVASAATLPNPVWVGAARAVSWLTRLWTTEVTNIHYCANALEALDWLAPRGAIEGLIVSNEARRFATRLDLCSRKGNSPATLFEEPKQNARR